MKLVQSAFSICIVLLALNAVLRGQLPASGTVIDVVPFNGGVAVASETRAVVLGTVCDGVTKLILPTMRKYTIVFEAGTGLIFQAQKPPSDLCALQKSGKRALDVVRTIVRELDARPNAILTNGEVEAISKKCLAAVKKIDSVTLSSYHNGFMFKAVVVTYDVESSRILVGAIPMFVDAKDSPYLKPIDWKELSTADIVTNMFYGDEEYVSQHVLRTDNRNIIPYARVWHKSIKDVSIDDAKGAAVSLVKTAEEVALKIPSPENGIGGPIDVATITKNGIEIKRRW